MNNNMETITFRDCVYKNHNIYFFSELESIPITIDTVNNMGTLLQVKNWELYRGVPYDLITELNGKIYALEMSGKYMCEYCLDTHEINYIQIDCDNRVDGNFALLTTEKNQIYIFDRIYGLTIYDIQSKTKHKISYPFINFEVISGCKCKNSYYLLPKEGNCFFEFNIISKKWHILYLQEEWKNAVHITVDEEYIFILTADGTIIECNTNNELRVIDVAQKWYKSSRAASRICITTNTFIILPSLEEDILLIDKSTFEVKVMQNYPNDFKYVKNNWTKYAGYCETEEYYFFACRRSEYILRISKTDDEILWIRSNIYSKEFFNYEKQLGIIREKPGYLDFLLNEII